MNYIKRLERENEEAKRRLQEVQDACQHFRVYLSSPKFTGVDMNGDRKDWVSTKEIDDLMQSIHSTAMNG